MGRLIREQQLKKIEQLGQRAKVGTIFGTPPADSGCATMSEYLSKFCEDTLAWDRNLTDKEIEHAVGLYRGAAMKDKEAMTELQTLRIEQTNNYIIPALQFGRFFEVRTLADNESPAVQNGTKLEFAAYYIGQDGGKEKKKAVPIFNETTIDLVTIATDDVTYPLMDIYRGRIAEAAKVTFDLNFDLENKIDSNLYTLLTAALGNFNTSASNRAARTYVTNSRIRSGVVPTSNDIDAFGSITNSSTFGQNTLDSIVNYCACWPKRAQGELAPTGEILVPADELYQVGSNVTITGQLQNKIAEEIMKTGWYGFEYNGVNWKFIKEHTMPKGKAIAQLNQPVGILWFKPGMSLDREEQDEKKNIGSRWMKKVLAMTILEPNRPNVLRVRYHS